MAVKNVSPPFTFCNAVSVTGANTFTSSVSSILYKDNIGLQYAFGGNPTGTLNIQVSNDYNPGLPESAGGSNAGTWTSVVQAAPNTLPVTVSSGTTSVAINMDMSCFAWLRTQYTNSSGTGTLTGIFAAKSMG